MKKYLIAFGVLVVFGLYLAFSNGQNSASVGPTPPVASTGATPNPGTGSNPGSAAPAGSGSASGGTSGPSAPPIAPPPAPTGMYKDGTYTGALADAIYGPLQVQITVRGGKLTGVTFPQYPNAGGHTSEVSGIALPILTQEAIQAQSANVDIVSGATQTSEAFQQSLGDALSQAQV